MQRRAALDSDTSLAEETKSGALELYDRALRTLESAEVMATRVAALEAVLESAEERTATLRGRLAAPAGEADMPSEVSLERLQTLVSERRTDLRIAREMLAERDTVLDNLVRSSVAYGDRLADLEQRQRRTDEELQSGLASEEAPAYLTARHTFLLTRQRLLDREIAWIRLEQGNYDALTRLYTLERDAAAAEVARLEPQVLALDALMQVRRADEARAATAQAEASQLATADMPIPVAALAEENTRLRAELEELVLAQSKVEERLRTTQQNTAKIESELAMLKRRIEVVGPSEAIGRVLRRRLARVPTIEDYMRTGDARGDAIQHAADRRIDIEEAQADFADTDQVLDSVLAAAAPELDRFDVEQVRAQTEDLLTFRLLTLTDLRQEYGRYLTRLGELDVAEAGLRTLVTEAVDYIYEELFWIKNLPTFSFADLGGLPRTLGWLFSAEGWNRAVEDGSRKFLDHPATSLLALLAVLGLFYQRSRAGGRMQHLAAQTTRIRTDKFSHTTKAMLYTVLAASAWPVLMLFTGWHIRAEPFGAPFSVVMGQGLMYTASILFVLSLWLWTLHPAGLGSGHFRWESQVMTKLANELRWLIWLAVPAVFILAATSESADVDYIKDLGRPTLILLMLATTVFAWRSFGPTSLVTRHVRNQSHGSWRARLQAFWWPLLVVVSVSLAVASLLGHHYTAVQLLGLLLSTISYLIGLAIVREVLLRWFYVAERRMRLREAIRRREEMRAQEEEHDETDSEAIEVEIPGVNYRSLGRQGRAIVQVVIVVATLLAIGLLWGDLLPAFGFITDAQLPFSRTEMIDGVQQAVPVTVGTFAVGLLVLLGTVFATRNLAGLLELTLFNWLAVDSGKRYAIISLSRYAIITVGIIFALSLVGLQWSKLGWLIAAMGVGLGFGLQEIVANFVSGIILLMERPIRVGDMVTVGDTIGTVAKIEIRAATIITLDRKELLVPNKEFITGRVLNWTLSNEEHRLFISVGIAYGSDAAKAMHLIMQAAKENERVLKEPAPEVTFESFGDNALILGLRAFIASVDTRLRTNTELHQAIYEKLADAGITIAFPQQDVHLDASKPLEIKLSR